MGESWALNEASLENIDRSGVLDAILEVDFRPVSSFGCDGVLISTPTGSTAYAFSAGGPILWPELDAILVVPNNAHALFTTPLVVAPESTVAVESLITTTHGKVVADGIRQVDMPPGSRLEVVHGHRPVRLVRLDDSPFTDRLVRKENPIANATKKKGAYSNIHGTMWYDFESTAKIVRLRHDTYYDSEPYKVSSGALNSRA